VTRSLSRRNPFVYPEGVVENGLLAAGLVVAGGLLGGEKGVAAVSAGSLIVGIFNKHWRETAYIAAALGAGYMLLDGAKK